MTSTITTASRDWRSARTALVVLLGATALAGCTIGEPTEPAPTASEAPVTESPTPVTASPTSPAPTPTFDPADAPAVGECRYIPSGGFSRFTDVSRLTDCDQEHTAETIWVGEVSGPEADERVPDYDVVVADAACDMRANEHFGNADWIATRLYVTAFVAPLEQWTRGARWVRCDIYVPKFGADGYRHGEALDAPVILDEATFELLAFCSTYDPDTPKLAVGIDCAEPHNYQTVAPSLDLSVLGEEFPGEEAVAAAAGEHCFPTLAEFVGSEPEAAFFTWSQPDQERWDRGERWVVCGVEIVGGRVAGSVRGVGDGLTVVPFAEGEDDPAIDPYDDA